MRGAKRGAIRIAARYGEPGVSVKGWKTGTYFIFMAICRYCALATSFFLLSLLSPGKKKRKKKEEENGGELTCKARGSLTRVILSNVWSHKGLRFVDFSLGASSHPAIFYPTR